MKNRLAYLTFFIFIFQGIINAQSSIDVQIGLGTTTGFYTPPIQDEYEGSRIQYLYRKSDLNSYGLTKGIISAIKFDLNNSQYPVDTVEQLQIKIGTTTDSIIPLTSWLGGTNTVYGPVNYLPIGYSRNSFTFSSPFYWNGVDNIVVEICNGDPNNVNPNINTTSSNYTADCNLISYVCNHTYLKDNLGNLCNTSNVNNNFLIRVRPNTIFSWQSTDSCLPANVVYSENFNITPRAYFPVCTSTESFRGNDYWSVSDNTNNPDFSSNTLSSYNASPNQGNSWFYTRGINLTGGTTYNLGFRYGMRNPTLSTSEKMNVFYGSSPTVDSMNNLIVDYPSINNYNSANSSTDFTPTKSGAYYIGFHAYSNPNQGSVLVDDIVVSPSTTTPVKLLSFTGERDGETNLLHWVTATEQNNKGFMLQRSADGENFSPLGFVGSKAAGGSSTANLNYGFIDGSPIMGTNYYRLKQVDIDGKSTLSNIVMIKGVKNTKLSITALYPNPVEHVLTLALASPTNNAVQIIITDVAGKIVRQIPYKVLSGDNKILLKVEELSKGTYVLKVVCNNGCEKAVGKFVKG